MNVAAYRKVLESEASRPQALLPEGLGLAVYGYTDSEWSSEDMFGDWQNEYHASESQGSMNDPDDPWNPEEDDEVAMAWCHHFLLEDDANILHRWNRAEDDLEVLDIIAQEGLHIWNDEILLAYRRAQLHVVCSEYFGTPNYMEREIVLRWERNVNGKFVPGETMLVKDWIELKLGEANSKLAGFLSAIRTLQYKVARRVLGKAASKKKIDAYVAAKRVLMPHEVEYVVGRALAVMGRDGDDAYMEL